jgi:CheY-like chemotaxis protein
VDDDPLVLSGTADMLLDLGHSVVEAESGEQALAALRDGVEVDLLATDHAMPGMTGLELARAARGLRPGLPVVLATGFAELAEGAVPADIPRLAKPYRQDQLESAIVRALLSAATRAAAK